MEGDQIDAIGMKLMLRGYREVKETVGTSRVDKGADWCSWKDVGGSWSWVRGVVLESDGGRLSRIIVRMKANED